LISQQNTADFPVFARSAGADHSRSENPLCRKTVHAARFSQKPNFHFGMICPRGGREQIFQRRVFRFQK
jgi:hypothetical protein